MLTGHLDHGPRHFQDGSLEIAAALQGAAQVYSEEAPAQDALAKRARPASAGAVAGTGERAPGRPHGSGPFGINLLSTERAEALRATHLLRPGPPEM